MSRDEYFWQPDLPPEAGRPGAGGFEVNTDWLKSADRASAVSAMCAWFSTRYCDPAHETPYDGGYVYIHGGPYSANEELFSAFAGLVDDEWIEEAANELEDADGILEWAPINYGPGEDEEFLSLFSLQDFGPSGALRNFHYRSEDLEALRVTARTIEENGLLRQMIFAQFIVLVEAFLQETMDFWIRKWENPKYKISFVEHCRDFQNRKIRLSDVYKEHGRIDNHIRSFFQTTVWHRLDLVMPLMRAVFGIETPDFAELSKAIVKRHHIIHRAGVDDEGNDVAVTDDDLQECIDVATKFVAFLDLRIQKAVGTR